MHVNQHHQDDATLTGFDGQPQENFRQTSHVHTITKSSRAGVMRYELVAFASQILPQIHRSGIARQK